MMVPPTPRKNNVPSKDILRWTARSLQQASGRGGDPPGSCKVCQEPSVTKIWGAVGRVIEHSLLAAARGVRIESLGTFTLDGKGRSRFFLAADFAARHRLLKYDTCSGGTLAGGAVNSRLNVARVAATAESPRPEAERVLGAVLRSLHQRLAEGRPVTLSFHPVAEFSCSPSGQATMRFLPGFRAKQNNAAVHATRARMGVAKTKPTTTAWAAPGADETASNTPARATTPTNAGSESAGQRPCSVSSRSTRSNATSLPVTPRSKHDKNRSSSPSASCCSSISAACNSSSTGSTIASSARRAATAARTGAATKQASAQASSIARRPKTSSSCSSSRDAPGAQRARRDVQLVKVSDRNTNSDDEAQTDAPRARGSSERKRAQRDNPPGGGIAESHNQSDTDWLSGLLRRQTLAQGGQEGLRRLTETLRLAHVSCEAGGDGNGGRLSGRDLLLALRDVGTSLTSTELADATGVFRRQPDGRISLANLLSELAGSRQRAPPPAKKDKGRHFPTGANGEEVGTPWSRTIGAVARDGSSGLPWERPSHQTGLKPVPSPRGSAAVGGTGASETSLSSPRLGESSTVEKQTRQAGGEAQGQATRGSVRGYGQQRGSSSGRERETSGGRRSVETGKAGVQAALPAWSGVPQQARRECWGDGMKGSGAADGTSGSNAKGDAIADLAGIIFHPTSSLEKLIHVLQASKVHEQPTMSCAALAARLAQIRPGLGKARARELAAAACRYPDKQVDLAQLHALFVRRFGRFRSVSSSSSGNGGGESGGFQRACSSSCAAVERVRRKLLSSSKGLRGLRAALRSVSGGAGGRGDEAGSLTKDELRRALTIAGGPDSVPPTTKDVDDLFTLFPSRGASVGVGAGRVDAETVLRGLRGEMSPHRERVVRDAFHGLLGRRASTSNNGERERDVAGDGAGMGGDDPRGIDGNGGHGKWCSSVKLRLDGDDEIMQALLAGGDGSQRDAPGTGAQATRATFEQFLDYYRDISAGIDGDDAFEARVRSALSSQHHPPRPEKANGGGGVAAAGVHGQREAAHVGGVRSLQALEGSWSSSSHQSHIQEKTPGDGHGRDRGWGRPAVSQQRLERLTNDKDERGRNVGKKDLRRGAGKNDLGLSLGAKEGGEQQQQQQQQQQHNDRVAYPDSPASAATTPALGHRQGDHVGPAEPTDPNSSSSGSSSSKPARSRKDAGGAGASTAFDRQGAATRVQSLFRGHKGRSHAAAEGRKRARLLAAERAAMEERLRPTAYRQLGGRISRPKGRSTYGF